MFSAETFARLYFVLLLVFVKTKNYGLKYYNSLSTTTTTPFYLKMFLNVKQLIAMRSLFSNFKSRTMM